MHGVLGTTDKTFGGNLEAGSGFPGLFGIGIQSCDRDGDIEMSQRQRGVVGESSLWQRPFRLLAIAPRQVDRPQVCNLIPGAPLVRCLKRHGRTSLSYRNLRTSRLSRWHMRSILRAVRLLADRFGCTIPWYD